MDERADRGEFYPGGRTTPEGGGGTDTGKVDRVNLGEIPASYTLKDVKKKVNQIVRAIAPAAVCIALAVVRLMSYAATAPLEDIPNTAPVVTNEEDAVAMAAVGALGAATSNQVAELSSAFRTGLADGTNAVLRAAMGAVAAESNRVDATFAKRSEIPAAPDLAPYALKSELPQDYLTENDITNFATRAWINSQNYAREGTVYTRLDAQDLAIDAATNAVLRDFRLKIDDLRLGTNALAVAHRTDVNALRAADTALSNRLDTATRNLDTAWRAGTNTLRVALAATSNNLQRSILNLQSSTASGTNRLWAALASASNRMDRATNEVMRIVRAESNRLDTATRNLDTAWRAGTNTLARDFRLKIDDLRLGTNALGYAMKAGTNRRWAAQTAASNRMDRATNEVMRIVRAESNRLDRATNELARADARLDAKIDALELTGGMTRLWSSDATIYQDATGTVWQVQDSLGPWQATTSSVQFVRWEDLSTEEYDLWKIFFSVDGTNAEGYAASPAGLTSYTLPAGEWEYSGLSVYGDFPVTFVRPAIPGGATNAVNRVAYTNDLAAATNGVMGEVDNRFNQWGEMGTVYAATRLVDQTGGGYDDVTAETVARKQDALPYPTNAIPYAAIDGAPSGGPEWRVVEVDENTPVSFVTNGIAAKLINGELYATTNGWPDGASMFVRGSVVIPQYDVGEEIRLVGYGTWPTNNFQSVWWRSGTNIFVNILVEE